MVVVRDRVDDLGIPGAKDHFVELLVLTEAYGLHLVGPNVDEVVQLPVDDREQ